MARSPGKRGRGTSDLGGTLTGLLRSTIAQAGVVRDVLERGARSGRAALDEALGDAASDRRRASALAELGEIVLELVREGEIDLAELPEIREVVERLDRIDDSAQREARREGGRWTAARGRGDDGRAELFSPMDDEDVIADDVAALRSHDDEDTMVGSPRRKTIPLPRHRGDSRDGHDAPPGRRHGARGMETDRLTPVPRAQGVEQEELRALDDQLGYHVVGRAEADPLGRKQAVTQRMRATRPPPLAGDDADDEVDDELDGEFNDDAEELAALDAHAPPALDERASLRQRVAAARGAADGTVSSASWRAPASAPRPGAQRVWRPTATHGDHGVHGAGAEAVGAPAPVADHRPQEDDEGDQPITARLRPVAAAGAFTSPDAAAAAMGRGEPFPGAELRTVEIDPGPVLTGAPRDALAAVTERSPFGTRRGGISFDDDLEEYMHPDDVPPREPS